MKHLIAAISIVALLGACQDRTGFDAIDSIIVRDFEDRADLSIALDGRFYSYCDFGCPHLCLMTPEPSVYRELDEQNVKKNSELRDRAKRSGLLFEVEDSGIIYDPYMPPEPPPEDVASIKLECIQEHRKRIERIETLLDRVAPEGG